jgi:hypothetical protein
MRRTAVLIAFLALSVSANAVTTRYLSDLRFDNLDALEFNNVSFVDGGGIELARATSPVWSYDEPVWSAENLDGGLLVSAGNTAKLLLVRKDTNRVVFEDTNQMLFSDMILENGKLYLSSIPNGKVTVLDREYRKTGEYALSNQYAWALVPADGGMYVLAGNPAELYFLDKKEKLSRLAQFSNEGNLLKGVVQNGELILSGDGNTLYRWSKGRISVVASFDNPIADFIVRDDGIFVVTSAAEARKQQQQQNAQQQQQQQQLQSGSTDGDVGKPMIVPTGRKQNARSSLWRVEKDGRAEEIFWKTGIRFISVAPLGRNFVVGSDKNGGYFEIATDGSPARFTSLGEGKFARFTEVGGETWAVLLEPSRILRLGTNYAPSGLFTSTVFDCASLSVWGRPIFGRTTPQGTTARLYTSSSLVAEEPLFDEWRVADSNVASPAGRYLRYRVELTGDGASTPTFRGLSVPYVQKNLAPRIERIQLSQTVNGIKVQWDAQDDNRDVLQYDVYLAPLDGDFVKWNERPLEENNIEIPRDNVPEGRYRVRVTASDAPSNPPSEARSSSRVSDPFLVDNTPPDIGAIAVSQTNGRYELHFTARDASSPIADAFFSVNGQRWTRMLPADGIFDNPEEEFLFTLAVPKGTLVQVKVSDLFGNYATKGLVLK